MVLVEMFFFSPSDGVEVLFSPNDRLSVVSGVVDFGWSSNFTLHGVEEVDIFCCAVFCTLVR